MPTYDWNCLACGNENKAGNLVCADCGCKPSASIKEIKNFRQQYSENGGVVLSSAGKLPEKGDNEIFVILGEGLTKLWRFPFFRTTPQTKVEPSATANFTNAFIFTCAILCLVAIMAYSVRHAPNGQSVDFLSFFMLWFREITMVILAFIVVICWLLKNIQQIFIQQNKSGK